MVTTYCDRDDIIDIAGEASILAAIDDGHDGVESAAETLYVTKAINRAAAEMNVALECQYILSELSGNEWCKWANASLALYFLRTRRNNPAEASVIEAVNSIRTMLEEIRWGRASLPEQSPSFDFTPAVSNMRPELFKVDNPIRVVREESTGGDPDPGIKRNLANQPGIF